MTALEEELTKKNLALEAEVKQLRAKLDLLIRKLYGSSSEKLNPDQLELLLEGIEAKKPEASAATNALVAEVEKAEKEAKKPKNKPKPRGLKDLKDLPLGERIKVVPPEVIADPDAWRWIEDVVTTQLDYQPAQFMRREIVRSKWAKKDQPFAPPVIAPLDTLQDRSIAAPGLLAQIIVAKYCDHLPLYRQASIYLSRYSQDLSRQTMSRWIDLAADWLKPIYREIVATVFSGGYVQVDETPVKYLCPGNGKTKTGYLWTFHRPGYETFFHWAASRGAEVLEEIMPPTFEGVMQSDGYAVYDSHIKKRISELNLVLAHSGCLSHARREFYDAQSEAPQQSAWVLRQIQHLYRIEARLREMGVGPRLRQAIRSSESRMIMRRLHRAFTKWKESGKYLKQGALMKAINYCLNQWAKLEAFLEDGRVEIDNNLVENAIRPTAIGKKNWLFIGDEEAGDRSAVLYTIIESCRRHGVDPWAYLKDVLTRLPTTSNREVADLVPSVWANPEKAKANKAARERTSAKTSDQKLAA